MDNKSLEAYIISQISTDKAFLERRLKTDRAFRERYRRINNEIVGGSSEIRINKGIKESSV